MEGREKNKKRMQRALVRLVGLTVLVALLFLLWRYSPLQQWTEPERLAELFDAISRSPWAGPIVVMAFLIGGFIVFPVTALIAATGVALGAVNGFFWASVGSLLSSILTYAITRSLPQRTIENWAGPWIARLGRRFERGGIVSVMLARNFPLAPFTLVNVVAGAARIPFRDYLIGTVLGMAPIIAALTILGDRLRLAWEARTVQSLTVFVLAIVLWLAVAFGLQSLSNRLSSARQV